MTGALAWALAKRLGGDFFALLRKVPWQAWLALAILLAGWRWGEHCYGAGVDDEHARWVAAQAKADQAAKDKAAKRDGTAQGIASDTASRAQQHSTDTRTETAAAAKRARDEIHAHPAPAGCPTGLPDRVRNEGRAAVDRAGAAGGPLRAGADAGHWPVAR